MIFRKIAVYSIPNKEGITIIHSATDEVNRQIDG